MVDDIKNLQRKIFKKLVREAQLRIKLEEIVDEGLRKERTVADEVIIVIWASTNKILKATKREVLKSDINAHKPSMVYTMNNA